ncbi:MacS family sensor histidine kinase [Thermomonospora amylolytica]|uniref:MacS family sensor histidine kinase n=1 Tax=Thermomonospora amylolytica TaxID=1411117 RepID=UPI000E6BB9ED|nr:DUF5931 domain-containing protein [Thermomonospora amylolytica]
MGFEAPLWRALAVFRIAALLYAGSLILRNIDEYRSQAGGWTVLAVMVAWTAYTVYGYADPARRRWPLLAADLAVAAGCLLATAWVERPERIAAGVPTLTMAWVAAPVLAWAVSGGKRRGSAAAAAIGAASIAVHGIAGRGFMPTQATFNGVVLVFLAGFVVGHVAELGIEAEARLARAIELEAATRERERLARRIHDSVLQVLALVQRRGGELGGEAAELGRLAGEQEAALRTLIGSRPRPGERERPGADADADLGALLNAHADAAVTVSAPAGAVPVPARAAREIDAAVAAALDNVRRHCPPGTRAWVLLEDDPQAVTVSVRDDGPGMPAGRVAEAEAAGRLGISQSIKGRIRDLGGTVAIVSAPGEGTEIEMTVPRARLTAA